LLRDRLKEMLGGGQPAGSSIPGNRSRPNSAPLSHAAAASRQSNGLEQFFNAHRDALNLSLLDITGANQANISYITELGHRLYSEDFVAILDSVFAGGDFYTNQQDPEKLEAFCSQCLGFDAAQFDGVLLWDVLQWVAPPLLQMTVDRLYEIMRPGATLLTFFHAENRSKAIPVYSYRILDHKTISLVSRGERTPAQLFNNRTIERLFARFNGIKFFLARDNLREVLVRR
jgi:hypothetical protein